MRICLLVVGLLLMGLPAVVLADEDGSVGVIHGAVVNETTDGIGVPGADVTLEAYLDSELQASIVTTKTDEEGEFRFEGLATDPDWSYIATTQYKGVEYRSPVIAFNGEGNEQTALISVYESTESDEAIAIPMAHMIMYVEEDVLIVREILPFVNGGVATYVGLESTSMPGARETLRFALPEGASGLAFETGIDESKVVYTQNGFVDTTPVRPGMRDVSFTYVIPREKESQTIVGAFHYPVRNLELFVYGEGIEVTSDRLVPGEPLQDNMGNRAARFSAQNLPAGSVLDIHVAKDAGSGGFPAALIVVLVVVVLGGAVLAFVLARKRRDLQPAAVASVRHQRADDGERQRLLAEIAQLDDDHELGAMTDEYYQRVRAEKKRRLIELSSRNREEDID